MRRVAEHAVLNARYLLSKLRGPYRLAFEEPPMHEFVLAGLAEPGGVRTLDVAKRLIDLGIHPPTVYFPLIVKEALMVEPTETESKRDLDAFADTAASAERVAEYLAGQLQKALGETARLYRVSVTEAPGCTAAFYPQAGRT